MQPGTPNQEEWVVGSETKDRVVFSYLCCTTPHVLYHVDTVLCDPRGELVPMLMEKPSEAGVPSILYRSRHREVKAPV